MSGGELLLLVERLQGGAWWDSLIEARIGGSPWVRDGSDCMCHTYVSNVDSLFQELSGRATSICSSLVDSKAMVLSKLFPASTSTPLPM